MKTIELLQGQEPKVLHHFRLPEPTGNKHIDCPICQKRRKFRLNMFNGQLRYICVCGSGNIINLIMETQGFDYATACKQIDEILGRNYEFKTTTKRPDTPLKEMLANRFSGLKRELKGTQVEKYLNSRGIYELPRMSVKQHEAVKDSETGQFYKAMFAVATNENMEVAYSHATYLEDGRKANITTNKRMVTVNNFNKPCHSCGTTHAANVAIRMFEHDTVLGISEGIESALSAKQLFNVPTWAVLNTSIMKAFKAPNGVKTLIIYADNDRNGAGLAAAFACGHKNILANNDVEKVIIRTPEKPDSDFNDMLLKPMATIDYELTR